MAVIKQQRRHIGGHHSKRRNQNSMRWLSTAIYGILLVMVAHVMMSKGDPTPAARPSVNGKTKSSKKQKNTSASDTQQKKLPSYQQLQNKDHVADMMAETKIYDRMPESNNYQQPQPKLDTKSVPSTPKLVDNNIPDEENDTDGDNDNDDSTEKVEKDGSTEETKETKDDGETSNEEEDNNNTQTDDSTTPTEEEATNNTNDDDDSQVIQNIQGLKASVDQVRMNLKQKSSIQIARLMGQLREDMENYKTDIATITTNLANQFFPDDDVALKVNELIFDALVESTTTKFTDEVELFIVHCSEDLDGIVVKDEEAGLDVMEIDQHLTDYEATKTPEMQEEIDNMFNQMKGAFPFSVPYTAKDTMEKLFHNMGFHVTLKFDTYQRLELEEGTENPSSVSVKLVESALEKTSDELQQQKQMEMDDNESEDDEDADKEEDKVAPASADMGETDEDEENVDVEEKTADQLEKEALKAEREAKKALVEAEAAEARVERVGALMNKKPKTTTNDGSEDGTTAENEEEDTENEEEDTTSTTTTTTKEEDEDKEEDDDDSEKATKEGAGEEGAADSDEENEDTDGSEKASEGAGEEEAADAEGEGNDGTEKTLEELEKEAADAEKVAEKAERLAAAAEKLANEAAAGVAQHEKTTAKVGNEVADDEGDDDVAPDKVTPAADEENTANEQLESPGEDKDETDEAAAETEVANDTDEAATAAEGAYTEDFPPEESAAGKSDNDGSETETSGKEGAEDEGDDDGTPNVESGSAVVKNGAPDEDGESDTDEAESTTNEGGDSAVNDNDEQGDAATEEGENDAAEASENETVSETDYIEEEGAKADGQGTQTKEGEGAPEEIKGASEKVTKDTKGEEGDETMMMTARAEMQKRLLRKPPKNSWDQGEY
ncbi:expressed unknown protein [Seminavis robusta]|uniref:Uncharacterized protein n=1 Tax=Seminavis robusta TaxID=568900 RepID=A0A9N8DWI4_9STRA|nr:expressed unknown protein [Seminavis robusta]|eukprot:Sro300_g111660.1 n/a (894) ;mRNA; r:17414-20327